MRRVVIASWWPLAASWLLMSAEQPAIAAVIARLYDAETHLAAWGGVVFAFALVIEAPIIMLLAASTELVRDRASHRSLRRFTHRAGFTLTLVHLVLVATPLYGVVVGDALGVPEPALSTARLGLALVLPWSWAIAWRRFNQGVLIRHGHARVVGLGTALRLATNATALAIGWALDGPGVVVAALALSSGVVVEGIYASLRVRPVVRELPDGDAPPLVGSAFWSFYLPLASTPLVTLLVQPLGTGAVSRMPDVLASLAVWPVLNGLSFVLSAPGLALNEVVVALWSREGARAQLQRFTRRLATLMTAIVLVLAATPLSGLWMRKLAALPEDLAALAGIALWIIVPVPASRVLQSWYQGVLVASRSTRAVSESVVVFAIVTAACLLAFVRWPIGPGVLAALTAFMLGRVAQTVHLAYRCSVLLRTP
jgi:progressive ankylosis protein